MKYFNMRAGVHADALLVIDKLNLEKLILFHS